MSKHCAVQIEAHFNFFQYRLPPFGKEQLAQAPDCHGVNRTSVWIGKAETKSDIGTIKERICRHCCTTSRQANVKP
jgi:hypothetical protein